MGDLLGMGKEKFRSLSSRHARVGFSSASSARLLIHNCFDALAKVQHCLLHAENVGVLRQVGVVAAARSAPHCRHVLVADAWQRRAQGRLKVCRQLCLQPGRAV